MDCIMNIYPYIEKNHNEILEYYPKTILEDLLKIIQKIKNNNNTLKTNILKIFLYNILEYQKEYR